MLSCVASCRVFSVGVELRRRREQVIRHIDASIDVKQPEGHQESRTKLLADVQRVAFAVVVVVVILVVVVVVVVVVLLLLLSSSSCGGGGRRPCCRCCFCRGL